MGIISWILCVKTRVNYICVFCWNSTSCFSPIISNFSEPAAVHHLEMKRLSQDPWQVQGFPCYRSKSFISSLHCTSGSNYCIRSCFHAFPSTRPWIPRVCFPPCARMWSVMWSDVQHRKHSPAVYCGLGWVWQMSATLLCSELRAPFQRPVYWQALIGSDLKVFL